MDCNCGRFFNSKSPAKSLKLYSPIWMDSNDSQFNMWNDFDWLYALPTWFSQSLSISFEFFIWVNELFPILIVFNRFNPSIWNVWTDPKQSSPISIDSTTVYREKSNVVYSASLQVQLGMTIEIIEEGIDWINLISHVTMGRRCASSWWVSWIYYWYHSYSLLQDWQQFWMNKVSWHFGDLEYLNTINIQVSEILSNITTRGYSKLSPNEWELIIDVRFGRSTKQIITNQFIITSHDQATWIIPWNSTECTYTELNGL